MWLFSFPYTGLYVVYNSTQMDIWPLYFPQCHQHHQACAIQLTQFLCASHKTVEACRNQHALRFFDGKTDMMCQWQHKYYTDQSQIPVWDHARTWAKHHEHLIEWKCCYTSLQSVHQSINQINKHRNIPSQRGWRRRKNISGSGAWTDSTTHTPLSQDPKTQTQKSHFQFVYKKSKAEFQQ
jgi:hypothetical protein